MTVQELDADTFDEQTDDGDWVIDFWASWCGPCKTMKPIFEDLSEEIDKVSFGSVNVEANEEVAGRFQVRSLPTFIYMQGGEVEDTTMGAMTEEELRDWIGSV